MDIPKGLAKKVTKKEIEELIKKTLVEKILAEDLGKQVKEYLELQEISRRLKVVYEKYVNIEDYQNLTKERLNKEKNTIYVNLDAREFILQETKDILTGILELSPNIKEAEIVYTTYFSFNITTNDFIYKLNLTERLSKEQVEKENEPGKPRIIYINPLIGGEVKYLKFNKEHNEKVIEVLKKRGYSVVINF